MNTSRRDFLKVIGVAGTAGVACPAGAEAEPRQGASEDAMGVLTDLTLCVGCRKCEYACQEAAGFDVPPLQAFEDKSVFEEYRRPAPRSYTVVNRFPNPADESKPVYVKSNCLHCVHPACASACLVGALSKDPSGPVKYDPQRCMGCRYCMVACPFQIPTYDYDNPLTPQVRKCTMCFGRASQPVNGNSDQQSAVRGVPACVSICPQDCLTYGRRSDLLKLAHDKIRQRPEVYVDNVYGEHEAGGTSWLYLSNVRFEDLGFLKLGEMAPSELTEMIQHGIFKHWVPPFALYTLLGVIMWLTRRESGQMNDNRTPDDMEG